MSYMTENAVGGTLTGYSINPFAQEATAKQKLNTINNGVRRIPINGKPELIGIMQN